MHKPLVKREPASKQVASAMSDGWMHGSSFVSSILSGTLLGYLADRWLGTEPWLLILGVALGSYSGFVKMWSYSKRAEEQIRDR